MHVPTYLLTPLGQPDGIPGAATAHVTRLQTRHTRATLRPNTTADAIWTEAQACTQEPSFKLKKKTH